jgi:hypothetical protein
MLKMPDNAISKLKAVIFEDAIKDNIEWENLAIVYVVSDLPANGTLVVQKADAFGDYLRLRADVIVERVSSLV